MRDGLPEPARRDITMPAPVTSTSTKLRRASAIARGPQLARLALATTRQAGPGLIGSIIGLQLITIVGLLVQLLAGRRILAELTDGKRSTSLLVTTGAVLVVAFTIASAAAATVTVLQRLLAERVSRHATAVVLQSASQTDLIEFESAALHDRLQRALINAASRPTQMTLGLLTVMSSLGTFVVLGVVVAFISLLLFGVAVVVAAPLIVIAFGSSRALYDFAVRQTEGDRERVYLQLLLSSREQAKEVRAYGLGPSLIARWSAAYDLRIKDLVGVLRRRVQRALAGVLVASVALGAGLATLVWLVTSNRVTLAAAATAATALLLMSRQAQTLAAGSAQLYETALFMHDYRYFADRNAGPPTLAANAKHRASAHRPAPGPVPASPAQMQTLTLDDVGFTYPSGHRPAVDDVSLSLRRGEVVALVGENGSGKSTLAKLIAGVYVPTSGEIRWNGVPYSQLSLDDVRRDIAVLFQDFIKFQMSARANITYGRVERQDETGEHVQAAAEVSGAASVLAELPRGMDTALGPQFVGGTELSGGQWQRLALARAAYRDASLVILDEPTAALDPLAEERMFLTTREVFAGKAVLLISHRFSSVRLADRILVLHHGRIVEAGDHDALMAMGGRYADMYRAQHEALLGPAPMTFAAGSGTT